MSDGTFDLRDRLANRKYPTTKIKVWVDEEGFFELAALLRKEADLLPGAELKDVERQIQNKKDELNESAIIVHLRGTSRRSREDMTTEALGAYPIKRDMMGREDELQTYKRGNLLSELYFAAHITSVDFPDGSSQEFTDDNRRDIANAMLAELPDHSVKMIDAAIGALRGDDEMEQGVNFLSVT